MDAKTREALERLLAASTQMPAASGFFALAGGVRALLDAPAEAPLRGEVHAAPHVRPYRADPAERWEVSATVLSPTREDAESVAAALRAVLARLT